MTLHLSNSVPLLILLVYHDYCLSWNGFHDNSENQSWLNLALIRQHLSPVIISSFHLDSTHWNAECGLARRSCCFHRILHHTSCDQGDSFMPQMVFADRSLILLCNPGFTGASWVILHSWQLLGGKPHTRSGHLYLVLTPLTQRTPSGRWTSATSDQVLLSPLNREISTLVRWCTKWIFANLSRFFPFLENVKCPVCEVGSEAREVQISVWPLTSPLISGILFYLPWFPYLWNSDMVAPLHSITMGTKWGTYVKHLEQCLAW